MTLQMQLLEPGIVDLDTLYWKWPQAASAIFLLSLLLWDGVAGIALLAVR